MAQRQKDPYEILGVERNASPETIKTAFRKLAAQHHPDRNPGDPQAAVHFKEINAAYQVLSDPDRRALYDRLGSTAEAPGSPFAAGGPFAGGVVDLSDVVVDGVLGDLLGLFGVGRPDRDECTQQLELTLEEVALGATKELRYERKGPCEDCRGTGAVPGSRVDVCESCGGRGRVRLQQGFLPLAVERVCARCQGTGRFVKEPCRRCRGEGAVSVLSTLQVSVPPGVDHGESRLIPGAGHKPKYTSPAGDLRLEFVLQSHPIFQREGDDVICKLTVPFTQAALGGEVDVPTLEGKAKIRLPPGTQPGSMLRLRGKGIARRMGLGRGDQRIEVTVAVPTHLTEQQRERVEQLAQALGEPVPPPSKSFMAKLREWIG